MKQVTILEITEQLQKLPQKKLAIVYNFVGFLLQTTHLEYNPNNESNYETILASEEILKRDWNTIEEDQT